jgi:hypothetical protein
MKRKKRHRRKRRNRRRKICDVVVNAPSSSLL